VFCTSARALAASVKTAKIIPMRLNVPMVES